jgi:hypothetical protein
MNTRSFLLSALIAGAISGALANLPLLNFVNCILCLWIWVGGFLAVWLYKRYEHGTSSISIGQGAGLGAASGIAAVFVGIVVYLLTSFLTLPLMDSALRALQIEGDLPTQSVTAGSIFGSTAVFFALNLVLYPLFGAISGLVAASIFGKSQPAPAAPQA